MPPLLALAAVAMPWRRQGGMALGCDFLNGGVVRSPGTPRHMNDSADRDTGPRGDRTTGRTLDSWKAIADFLDVSVRTAHRWKDAAGMPVYRTPAGHVWSNSSELERWRRRRSQLHWRRWFGRKTLVTGVAAGAAACAFLWYSNQPGPPASVLMHGQQVTALDEAGHSLWTATVAQRLGSFAGWGWQVSTPDRYLVADLDEDGHVEVVLNVLSESAADAPGRLVCYADDGRVRWEFVLGREVKDAFGEYTLDYVGHILKAVRIGGRPFVLSITTHRRWHPSQVALLDPRTGHVVEEFWHPGAITHALVADVDRDGAEDLVLAGLNNPGPGPGSPVLMTLRLPFSLQPAVPASLLAELSHGGPVAYVVFPRPDVLEAEGGMAGFVHILFEETGTLLARLRFAANANTNLTYRLDPALRMRDVFATIDLAPVHNTLWKAGALSHEFSPEEQEWLQTLRRFPSVPDGNAQRIRPFAPPR